MNAPAILCQPIKIYLSKMHTLKTWCVHFLYTAYVEKWHQMQQWQPWNGVQLTELDSTRDLEFMGELQCLNLGVRLHGQRFTHYKNRVQQTDPQMFHCFQPHTTLHAKPVRSERYAYKSLTISATLLEEYTAVYVKRKHTDFLLEAPNQELNVHLKNLYLHCHARLTQPVSQLEQKSALVHLLHEVILHFTSHPIRQKVGAEHWAVRQVQDFIRQHAFVDIDLDELGKLCALHPVYVVEVFKQSTGLTPHQYQTMLRLEQAKKLLDQGMIAAAVALEIGLHDQSHLNRLFKRYIWCTPLQYHRRFAN